MIKLTIKPFVSGRIKRCRAAMTQLGLDALIVTAPSDVTYLTGFSGDDSVLVLTPARRVLVTDSRYTLQARQECPGLTLHLRKGPIPAAVAGLLSPPRKPGRKKKLIVGLDPDAVTVSSHRSYRKALDGKLTSARHLVGSLRLCKDDYEIAQVQKAIRLAQAALLALLPEIRPGASEQELAARLEYEMARRGSRGAAFPTIAAVGPHAAQPHALPGPKRLTAHQSILFDWGATVNGYKSDLTRCCHTGKIPPAYADAYQRVLDAQLAAIEAVRPGATLAQVDAAARSALEGCPGRYQHGTGHGIGLDIHERPGLAPQAPGELRDGMIVTIEPGIYRPGQFGIRIEDDVLVTARGRTVLSNLPKALDDVRL